MTDRDALKARMRERFEATMEETLKAVEQAPDGQWIAASEWQIRQGFQELTAECYRQMLQARIQSQPSAKQAAFSPSRQAGGGVAQQGDA